MPWILSLPREASCPLLLYLPPSRMEWSLGQGRTEPVTSFLESVESHSPPYRATHDTPTSSAHLGC